MNNPTDKQELILQLLHKIDRDQIVLREDMSRRFTESEKQDTEFRNDVKLNFSRIEKQDEEFRSDVKQRFSEASKRDEEFRGDVKQHFKEVKYDLRLDKEKLEKVYEARERVTVNFTRAFALGNASFAAIIAVIISFFMPHR